MREGREGEERGKREGQREEWEQGERSWGSICMANIFTPAFVTCSMKSRESLPHEHNIDYQQDNHMMLCSVIATAHTRHLLGWYPLFFQFRAPTSTDIVHHSIKITYPDLPTLQMSKN